MIPRRPVEEDAVALVGRNLQVVNDPSPSIWEARVVVGLTVSNASEDVARSLDSALRQKVGDEKLAILVLLDTSGTASVESLSAFAGKPRVVIVSGCCGSAARARNAVLDFVDGHFEKAEWVARLDADDVFSTSTSLAAACALGDLRNALFVLGGNRLVADGALSNQTNPATEALLDPHALLRLLRAMADGTARNELPSCNLLLRTRTRLRYPEHSSAEDHWFVTYLLLFRRQEGAILESPFFVDYTLSGSSTKQNRREGNYRRSRRKLADAAGLWVDAIQSEAQILGFGNEGIVVERDGWIEKRFYADAISSAEVERLEEIIDASSGFLPPASFAHNSDRYIARYPFTETEPVEKFEKEEARTFLIACLKHRVVCLNIKPDNFRRKLEGGLLMIDLGRDIAPFNVDFFIDSAARLYAQSVLGWEHSELLRRKCGIRQEDALMSIPGFAEFYGDLMRQLAANEWGVDSFTDSKQAAADDVSLLVKACAMDIDTLAEQVRHIVTSLSSPTRFAKRILLIDTYSGPFLREHCKGDLGRVFRIAEVLKRQGWIDAVWTAPNDPSEIRSVLERWFGIVSEATHTIDKVPLASQLWAFEQSDTPYLLQCDVDIICDRRDREHDYLLDMLGAIQAPDVVGVAFNIPKPPRSGFQLYDAPPGAYVPEVRCGLLDMRKLFSLRPLPNALEEGKLTLSWYRSLEKKQKELGLKTLRGGDPRTFYMHPPNHLKGDSSFLGRIRDLAGQGWVSESQFHRWDLIDEATTWAYPRRSEEVVFLIKGRNTLPWKIERCFRSLEIQKDENFGVVLIDDHSTNPDSMLQMGTSRERINKRVTHIRNEARKGHLANIDLAVREICINPDTLVVILDMDDALITSDTVSELRMAQARGHDVVLAAPFRPEKPLKSYAPDFSKPRNLDGGEVWIHLRAFRKRLFEEIPVAYLQLDGKWVPECTDYALMVPMVELAKKPAYWSHYLYFHERSGSSNRTDRERKDTIISKILKKPSLAPIDSNRSMRSRYQETSPLTG